MLSKLMAFEPVSLIQVYPWWLEVNINKDAAAAATANILPRLFVCAEFQVEPGAKPAKS